MTSLTNGIIEKCIGKISKDSRNLNYGDVYLALSGENFDGHDFVSNAFENGASMAIVNREIPNVPSEKLIIVPDTLLALHEIASYVRKNTLAKIIAITGSCGKTSIKEMLKVSLETQGKIWATQGNLNNNIGLPLTLANMPLDTEFGIIEMGMNHTGELLELTAIAKPDIVIISNIGNAHHEFFPTRKDIAAAKSEAFSGLNKNGFAIIHNGDFYDLLAEEAKKYTDNIISFGDEGYLQLIDYHSQKVTANICNKHFEYTMKMPGRHQALNTLPVLCAVELVGKSIKEAINNLSKMEPMKGRGQITQLETKVGKIRLIDDAYNASPDSVIASIRTFGELQAPRKIIALGEMRELGEKSKELHEKLVPEILKTDIEKVYCCCENMRYLFDMLPVEKQGAWAPDSQSLWQDLQKGIQANDSILVKGSLGSNMLYITEQIKKMGEE